MAVLRVAPAGVVMAATLLPPPEGGKVPLPDNGVCVALLLLTPPEGRTPLDSPSLLADANHKKATGISGGFLLSLFLVQGAALWTPPSLLQARSARGSGPLFQQ